jgi:7-cyano-7-deazaguanine synthase
MEIVALVSGGIDSLTMCKLLEREGYKLYPIFIDYGQRANKKEWDACLMIFEKSNFPKPEKIDLNGYGRAIRSGITDPSKDIYKEAFLPGRNMLFLLVAASYGFQRNVNTIAIGFLTEKNHLFQDQTSEFLVNANFALNAAIGTYFTILTPLIQFSKEEVVKIALHHKLPLNSTYSCHSGQDTYCRECVSCKEIMQSIGTTSLPQFHGGGKK